MRPPLVERRDAGHNLLGRHFLVSDVYWSPRTPEARKPKVDHG